MKKLHFVIGHKLIVRIEVNRLKSEGFDAYHLADPLIQLQGITDAVIHIMEGASDVVDFYKLHEFVLTHHLRFATVSDKFRESGGS